MDDAIDGLQRCLDLNPTNMAANELLTELPQLENMLDRLSRSMILCELVHASHSTQPTNESRDIDIRPLVFKSDIDNVGEQGPSCPPEHFNVAESLVEDEDEWEDEGFDYDEFIADDEDGFGEEGEEICSQDECIADEEEGEYNQSSCKICST
jgi:hypothetical protein